MADRCIHGMDSRFCANCNRAANARAKSEAGGTVSLTRVMMFLNAEEIRATYGAVGEAVGLSVRVLGTALGDHRPDASWVVNASSGLPTGYDQSELHPQLMSKPEIISSGRELLLRISLAR